MSVPNLNLVVGSQLREGESVICFSSAGRSQGRRGSRRYLIPRGIRQVGAGRKRLQGSGESSRQGDMVEFKEVEQGPEDGSVDDDIDSLLSGVGKRMLFEERPVGLTALFRFQTGSDIFYGELRVGFPVNACMCRMREKRERQRKRERGLHSVVIDAWCFVQRGSKHRHHILFKTMSP